MKRVCIVGASGSGKTTLIRKLVARLSRRGLKVGTLKHAHHDFDMDVKGKDSHRHFAAGAAVSAVVSPNRSAVFRRAANGVWGQFRGCDLVLVEGFRGESRLPKIEVFRRAVSPRPLFQKEGFRVRAVVSRDPVPGFSGPSFRPGQLRRIQRFILSEL